MITLLFFLISQDGLGVQIIEATELLERKPHFAYEFPQWVTDDYLFNLAGFPLDEEIEKCIDATILTAELGGKPLNPALAGPSDQLAHLKPDSAMRILARQLDISPPPEIRRQIMLYRITGDWLLGDLKSARQTLKTLEADKEATVGLDISYVNSLLTYWEKGEVISTGDSLLYHLLVKRDPGRALIFLPDRGSVSELLRYHLDETFQPVPEGHAGRYLGLHRLVRKGRWAEAADSLDALSEIRSPYSALVRYDMAQALLGQDKSREAHLWVPDSFQYQWLLPQGSLALVRGQVEWMQQRQADARKWFRLASANPAFDLYSQWVMSTPNASTEAYFAKLKAVDLYDLLRVTAAFRSADYSAALPMLEGLLQRSDISHASPKGDLIVAFYITVENEKGDYRQSLRLAEAVRQHGAENPKGDYFLTAAHLYMGDAYYYTGGRHEELARPFYEYCTQSRFADLRHRGYFGLAWSYLGDREFEKIEPLLAVLEPDSLDEFESEMLTFFKGLVLYAKRDFQGAAEGFSKLNLSSVSQMRMQGLYFEGRSWEQIGEARLSASAYDDLLKEFPAAVEVRDAWTRLARAQLEMGEMTQAEATLERLMERGRLYHFEFVDLYREILLLIYDAAMREGQEGEARQIAERLSRTQNSTLPLETFYYRVAEKDTALWQADHLIGIVDELSRINAQSVYLPPLLLKLARMEIELGDYELAATRLELILQWRKLSDVSSLLPEVSYELVRAWVLAKDWSKVILRSEIFLNSYPESEELTPRVLFFRAIALVERAGNGDSFARKQDGKDAIEALDRLESSFSQTTFVKESSDDIKTLRRSAEFLLK